MIKIPNMGLNIRDRLVRTSFLVYNTFIFQWHEIEVSKLVYLLFSVAIELRSDNNRYVTILNSYKRMCLWDPLHCS